MFVIEYIGTKQLNNEKDSFSRKEPKRTEGAEKDCRSKEFSMVKQWDKCTGVKANAADLCAVIVPTPADN